LLMLISQGVLIYNIIYVGMSHVLPSPTWSFLNSPMSPFKCLTTFDNFYNLTSKNLIEKLFLMIDEIVIKNL